MAYSVSPFKSISDSISRCENSEYYGNGYDVHESDRFKYLDKYLKRIEVRTVIIEHEYVDRNFIDDYCGYYARSFRDYPKKCVRLLLFSSIFDDDHLKGAVSAKDNERRDSITNSFLGYIVLRPIPGAHLGKVCIATYPNEAGKLRIFPLCKPYHAHFMGMTLTVGSVAFQEQDNVISACATSALWTAFHCIKSNVLADVPSPFKITDMDSSDYLILALHHRRDIFDLYCAPLSDWSNEEFDNYISGNRKNIAVLKSLLTSYRNGNPAEKLWHS